MNFEGELSSFKGSLVTFCFEEVSGPSSQGKDSLVGNVSDAFGLTFLVANRVASSDGCYVKIEKDFSYKIDLSEAEGIPNARVDADVYIETPATTVLPTDTAEVTAPQTTQAVTTDAPSEPTTEPIVKEPVGQTNIVVYLVCILLSVGSIVVIVLNRKGKGQSK